MRFILTYRDVHQNRLMVGLGTELLRVGHEVRIIRLDQLRDTLIDGNVIIEINHPRDDHIPKNTIHISWIQDYRLWDPPRYDESAYGNDLIYTLGHGPAIGIPCEAWPNYAGSLLPGIEPSLLLEHGPVDQDIDLSLCGVLSEPFIRWKNTTPSDCYDMATDMAECVLSTIERNFRPLTGGLDQQFAVGALRDAMEQLSPGIFNSLDKEFTGQIVHEIARTFDRMAIADLMLRVSHRVAFYGAYWELWPSYSTYCRPHVPASDLIDVYRRSRISIHNNIFGFGLHTRVFEIMASGGFLMTHETAHPEWNGRVTSVFEPEVHFGAFTAENFIERARNWLDDPEARSRASKASKAIIAGGHLWQHRAQRILRDLR